MTMERTAEISADGVYRTRLDRIWNHRLPICPWICLNPSKADGKVDDPSVIKMIGFSSRLGYGGLVLFNVLALRATDPRELLNHPNPYGPKNEAWRIADACRKTSTDAPIFAWGNIHRLFWHDALEVVRAFSVGRCFGYCVAQPRWPRHPLMLPYSTRIKNTDASRWIHLLNAHAGPTPADQTESSPDARKESNGGVK